jgi:hypothetical protein
VLAKFDYYDAIAHVIPGTVACLFILYALDILGMSLPRISEGSLAQVGIGVAVAYTVGHLLQGLASSLEPLYYFAWGGKPSVMLLERPSQQFSDAQRRELIKAMVRYFGFSEECPANARKRGGYYQRLFERGMALCNREKLGRLEPFVTSYAFHRVLLTTFLMGFLVSVGLELSRILQKLQIHTDKLGVLRFLLVATAAGTAIEFFRARKRAYYYAREVLWMTADHLRACTNTSEKQPTK